MLKLKPNRDYIVDSVYQNSSLWKIRHQILGARIRLTTPSSNFRMPSLGVVYPRCIRNAQIEVYSGVLRGQVFNFTRFLASIIPLHVEVCECKAYPFPHREGGGKCLPNEHGAYCASCGLACMPRYVDNGIGPTEFWGAKSWHHDWEWESDCCECNVYSNSTLTVDYEPEE
jgi:hypothetical protein